MGNSNSILRVAELENLLRTVHKIDSKMLAGQFIGAYREIGSLRAYLERARDDGMAQAKQELDSK